LTYAQIKDKITDFIDSSVKLITTYSENKIDQLTDPVADSKSVING